MCGIFGLVVSSNHNLDQTSWKKAIHNLFELSETRGKEAAGIAVATNQKISVHKDSVSATRMLKTKEYQNIVDDISEDFFAGNTVGSLSTIGHSRLVTNGLQGIDANNQPVWRDDAIIVHNGIVVNVDELWAAEKDIKPRAEVDSEVIAALIEKYRKGGMSPAEAVSKTFSKIYGETSIAMLFADLNIMVLATNTGSIYLSEDKNNSCLLFVSEKYICEQLTKGDKIIEQFKGQNCVQLPAGQGLVVDLDNLKTEVFSFDSKLAMPQLAPRLAVQRKIEEKSDILRQARENMKRCTKCLLPETMPYIEYDNEGVCNYCHNYKPMVQKEESELEAHLARYRKNDGSPDCMVAFSGGRDSSYGLHLLKTKFDMNPIAFTYDWGMVTDLGRRNQARLCGKLGVEHIWVSADIKKKRDYIRRNILAWSKKPDIGMIPLFIAGDKHTFVEGNKVMDQCGLDFIVYCPNKLEKTDFKTGFCGIAPDSSENQPFALSTMRKLQLIKYYGKQFLSNPSYINRSFFDTFSGFYSLYYQTRDYTYLFDYLEWKEDEVDKTIIDEYGWELSPETKCAWRIGDGTAPFYNYVYHTVAGFTEHDTFRSNQIREGQLTREQALKLVKAENIPRWDSFREYTGMINIDFDELIRVIDRIPKLYVPQ